MPSFLEADVIIAGAGPAGSSLAARLAAGGLAVILLDRARFPRDKLCGEFLSPESLARLAELGVRDTLRTAGGPEVRSFRFTAAGGATLERPLRPGPGLAVSRRVLDATLASAASAAGAQLIEGARVTALQLVGTSRFQAEWLTSTGGGRARASAVVDATGRAERIPVRAAEEPRDTRLRERIEAAHRELEERTSTRPTGSMRPADGPLVAFKRHYRGGAGRLGGAVEIHAFPGGYCGLVEVEAGLINACFVAPTAAFRAAGGRAAPLLDTALAASHHLAARFEGLAPQDEGFLSTTRVPSLLRGRGASPSGLAAAIGDAATAIPPVCGDGMSMALHSAALAAPLIEEHLGSDAPWSTTQARIAEAIERSFRKRRFLGGLLQAAMTQPWPARGLVRLGRLLPFVADALARHTRG